MQSLRSSFNWSEDLNEALNYWFWLRRAGKIDDHRLIDEIGQSIHRERLEAHERVVAEPRWLEYLSEFQEWKRAQASKQIEDSRTTPVASARAHYQAVASVGLSRPFRVEWVMAPIGERWLFPPHVAVLGAEGATGDQRRRAVLAAAKALQPT
jgi:hypothetical protein